MHFDHNCQTCLTSDMVSHTHIRAQQEIPCHEQGGGIVSSFANSFKQNIAVRF